MVLFANDVTIDPFLQYGSFGLLAILVFWCLWKGIPAFLEIHRGVVTDIATKHEKSMSTIAESHRLAIDVLVKGFEREADECRKERKEEGEKNRQSRTEANAMLVQVLGEIRNNSKG